MLSQCHLLFKGGFYLCSVADPEYLPSQVILDATRNIKPRKKKHLQLVPWQAWSKTWTRAKITLKIRLREEISSFEVLDVLFEG